MKTELEQIANKYNIQTEDLNAYIIRASYIFYDKLVKDIDKPDSMKESHENYENIHCHHDSMLGGLIKRVIITRKRLDSNDISKEQYNRYLLEMLDTHLTMPTREYNVKYK